MDKPQNFFNSNTFIVIITSVITTIFGFLLFYSEHDISIDDTRYEHKVLASERFIRIADKMIQLMRSADKIHFEVVRQENLRNNNITIQQMFANEVGALPKNRSTILKHLAKSDPINTKFYNEANDTESVYRGSYLNATNFFDSTTVKMMEEFSKSINPNYYQDDVIKFNLKGLPINERTMNFVDSALLVERHSKLDSVAKYMKIDMNEGNNKGIFNLKSKFNKMWDPKIGYTVLLSVITLVLNLAIYFKTRKEVQHNQAVTLFSTIRQFNSDLRKWADEVVEQMSIAVFLCDLDPANKESLFFEKRHQLRVKLSSLLDRGRFFLPNSNKKHHGQHKRYVFQGIKDDALEAIEQCLNLVQMLDYKVQHTNLTLKEDIVDAKKNFVSSLDKELDPEKFERDIKRNLIELTKKYNYEHTADTQ